jgi:ribosomal protein L11 methyltransferase
VPWAVFLIEIDEAAADVVMAHLAQRGVAVEVRDAETVARPAPGRVELLLYVAPERAAAEEAALTALLSGLAAHLPAVRGYRLSTAELDDETWRDAWKRFFRAQRVGRFLVRPSWDQVEPAAGERVIDLDPGRAFGTGAHGSTRLCLVALERIEAAGAAPRRILDAGCGSGILSIAALRPWPQAKVVALDMDPEAVATARENAERNGLLGRITFVEGDAAAAPSIADLVLANIQREVLEAIAEELSAAVAPDGWLVLSGLLTEQAGPVADAYVQSGLTIVDTLDDGEWRAVMLRRQ